MNFKRFNGSTWETVRHKIYGSGTEQLVSFPVQIQAAGEPLTDYLISGNTIQDGTPTPEAPVDVVGCGVWDETYQSYKLTPTVNGTEYPIYLGEAQTTRRIKKLVLTGDENWEMVVFGGHNGFLTYAPQAQKGVISCICSHYKTEYANKNNTIYFIAQPANGRFIIFDDRFASATDFKSYLAAQYAAGTPVTVWYVLAEPEAAVVNEPMHKIGNYTDTITMAQAGVTIPTFDGDNIISFGTTVQPSAMSSTFNGWHPVQGAKVYDGNDWR